MTEDSLLNFIGSTPIVKLNSLSSRSLSVFAKLEYYNLGGSVKARSAKNMIFGAIRRKQLTPDKILLDSSSGNTGIAYALICSILNIKLTLVMPGMCSEERKKIVKKLGAEIIESNPLEGSDGAIKLARKMYEENPNKYFYINQYDNPDNYIAHYNGTASEIYNQTNQQVTHIFCGIGTSGTAVGISLKFHTLNPFVQVIGIEPDDNLHGLEGLKHIPSSIMPKIYLHNKLASTIRVNTQDAYNMVDYLAKREGILCGFSSGAVTVGCLEYTKKNNIKNGIFVLIFADSLERYLSTPYFKM